MSYDVFRDAILNRQQVVCEYAGFTREVCPHVIGTKRGRRQVLTWQFAGGSSSGLPPEGMWRCMEVDKVTGAKAQNGDWHTGARHTQPQTCVDLVDVEVAYLSR
jgi:hypothetical protein